jgi:hypothetical protein
VEPCVGASVTKEESFRNESLEVSDTGSQEIVEIDRNRRTFIRQMLRRNYPCFAVVAWAGSLKGKNNGALAEQTKHPILLRRVKKGTRPWMQMLLEKATKSSKTCGIKW